MRERLDVSFLDVHQDVDQMQAYAVLEFVTHLKLPRRPAIIHTTSTGNPVVIHQTGDFYYALAMCETHVENLNTGNGFYGFFQFSAPTWRANGGTGLPSDFDYETQKKMAMKNITPENFRGQHPACAKLMLAEGWVVPID